MNEEWRKIFHGMLLSTNMKGFITICSVNNINNSVNNKYGYLWIFVLIYLQKNITFMVISDGSAGGMHGRTKYSNSQLDPPESVCWRDCAVVADYLSPHHVVPEVPEVEQHAEHYDDAEHEHVLACPLDSSWLVGDFVLVVASCLSVLGSKDEGIDDVNCHEGSEAACCDDGIPVGAEQFADLVVGFLAEEGYNVHAPMEGQEEDKRQSRYRHDDFPSD